MSGQSDFAAKVEQLIKQARDFGPAVRDRVMELLEEARKRIVGDISNVDPQSFKSAQLRLLAKQIDGAMDKFRAEFTGAVTSAQSDAYDLGGISMAHPLDAAGMPTGTVAGISESALSIAQGYTADLIAGLSKDAAGKLNAAIQRAFLGGQSVSDIIAQVGRALAGDKFTGLFGPIGDRAETVALNEILRVHSMAGQARLEDLQQQVPSVKKQWIHIMAARVPRIAHIHASGQVRAVDEPFSVGGEELMYPRDPNGSPENTINCHCLLAPYVDAADLKPTAEQKQVLKDAGIQISVTP
ncbi:MAG TPA: phage minor head protein [Candidatus Acidoferrum sp.]|nr:phage minor head protein [Candidatus Acidoferrum sp.]